MGVSAGCRAAGTGATDGATVIQMTDRCYSLATGSVIIGQLPNVISKCTVRSHGYFELRLDAGYIGSFFVGMVRPGVNHDKFQGKSDNILRMQNLLMTIVCVRICTCVYTRVYIRMCARTCVCVCVSVFGVFVLAVASHAATD